MSLTRPPLSRLIPLLSVLIWLSPSVRAEDAPKGEDAALMKRLESIDARGAGMTDLSAKFTQEKFTALLKKPLVSSGTVKVKGGKVRWDTEKPEPGVLFSDSKEIKLYYPAQKTVEVYPIDQRLSEFAASPLPRLETLRKLFSIEQVPLKDFGTEGATDENQLALKLTPKDAALREHVDHVRVLLDVKAAHILKAETVDSDDDRTVITFSDVKLNAGLKDADLDLVLPPGTKVSRPLDAVTGGEERK
jgi:outer membrane lipoprotein-sorting protein